MGKQNQTELIFNSNWDVLVILDACRFDKFKEIYKEILGEVGNLKKVISPATHTIQWLNKTFNGKYLDDVIYLSSNAFVNSKGVTLPHGGYTFDGRKHFKRIIDVWKDSWDEEKGTVHPIEMNKSSITAIDLYKNNRFIIHYLQPHAPYLYYGGLKGEAHKVICAYENINDVFNWKHLIGMAALKILNHETVWKIGKFFGVEPRWGIGRIWYRYGKEGIIKGYMGDLKLALEHIKKLIERYPNKKFIITSDHGERLGEHGKYEHGRKRDKEVIEVPWLIIERRI